MQKFYDFLDFKFNLANCFMRNKRMFYSSIAIIILLFGIFYMMCKPLAGLYVIIVGSIMWRLLCEVLYFIVDSKSKTEAELIEDELNEE